MLKKRIREAATLSPPGEGTRWRVRIIEAPRWGSSGYYSREVVERDGAAAFPVGTQMFLDHPGDFEAGDRPERSVRDLAGKITSTPTMEADGLYADVELYSWVADLVREMGDDIGLSIRAAAQIAVGKAEGREGPIITHLVEGISVDLVTKAGAGGKFVTLLESARPADAVTVAEAATNDRWEQLRRALRAANPDGWSYPLDFDEARHIVWYEAETDHGDRVWQDSYTPADDDMSVTLDGQHFEVRPVTTFHPVTPAGPTPTKEAYMPQIEEARLNELTQAADRVPTLESERDAAVKRADEAEARIAAAETAAYEAQVNTALAASTLPEQAQARVRESLTAGGRPDAPAAAIEAAIKAEADYLAAVAPTPRKLGFGAAADEPVSESYVNAWGRTIDRKGA